MPEVNYFLECSQCHHLNPVKSEFLTFCSNCNTKLANSFANWKLSNAGKSYEDYLNEVCIPREEPAPQDNNVKKEDRRKRLSCAFMILTGILALVFIGFTVKTIIKAVSSKPLETLLTKEWSVQGCGTSGLSLNSPVRMKPSGTGRMYDKSTRKYIKEANYLTGSYGSKFTVSMKAIVWKAEIKPTVRAAAEFSVRELIDRKGVKNLTMNNASLVRSGLEGIILTGNSYYKGIEWKFYNVVFVNDQLMMEIQVVFDASENAGDTIAGRIVDSIDILVLL